DRGRRQAARGHAGAGARGGAQRDAFEAGGMNPSRLFILRPVATSLLMAAIMLAGTIAYHELPVSALPQVDYPTIQVLTFYPADLQQDEPGRRAGPDARAHLRRAAAVEGAGPRRHPPRAEDLAAPGGRPGEPQRRAEAGRAHPGEPDGARRLRDRPRRRARRDRAVERPPGQ